MPKAVMSSARLVIWGAREGGRGREAGGREEQDGEKRGEREGGRERGREEKRERKRELTPESVCRWPNGGQAQL
eukprot:962192-Rhodomonas_salina.1